MSNPIFILTVTAPNQDTETAIFATQAQAEAAAIAAVDPYERGEREYDRCIGQGGAVVFLTSEAAAVDGEEETEARVTPAEPTPAQQTQLQANHREERDLEALTDAIRRARALLDRTEEWAAAWHQGESGPAPFGVSGLYYAGDLTDVALTAQAYRGSAETKARLAE